MVNLNVGVSDPVPVSGDSRANDSSAGEKAKQYLKDISIIADSNMDQKEKLDRIAVRTEEFINDINKSNLSPEEKQLYINYANQSSDFLSFNINIKDIASDPTIDSKEKVDRINAQFQAYINKVDQNLNLSAAQKEEYIKDVRLVVDQTIMLIQNPTVQKPSPFDLFKR